MAALDIPNAIVDGAALDATKVEANFTAIESHVNGKFPVVTADLTDLNVTTAKLADSNVTTAKIADLNVTTAKLAAGAVTPAKQTFTKCRLSSTATVPAAMTVIAGWAELDDASGLYASGSTAVITEAGLYAVSLVVAVNASNVQGVNAYVYLNERQYGTAVDNVLPNSVQYGSPLVAYLGVGQAISAYAQVINAADAGLVQVILLTIVRIG